MEDIMKRIVLTIVTLIALSSAPAFCMLQSTARTVENRTAIATAEALTAATRRMWQVTTTMAPEAHISANQAQDLLPELSPKFVLVIVKMIKQKLRQRNSQNGQNTPQRTFADFMQEAEAELKQAQEDELVLRSRL
jgi:hypothetical protein